MTGQPQIEISPPGWVASRLGWTEGQLWTAMSALVFSVALGVIAVPPALQEKFVREVVSPTRFPDGSETTDVAELAGPSEPGPPDSAPFVNPGPGVTPDLEPARPERPLPPLTPPTTAPPTTAPPPGPLQVYQGGYASALAGTPAATAGVPQGALPVGRRGGRDDKTSFVRLRGSGSALVLAVDQTLGANRLDQLASVHLCPVTTKDWKVGEGDIGIEQAPAFDCRHGITGTRSPDGASWRFDLAGAEPSRPDGFALVPDAQSPLPDFQVAFRPQRED